MKDIKQYFERLFNDSWLLTPIHFAGQEFDQDKTVRWINPVYTPQGTANSGVSKDARRVSSTISIICWAENDLEVMALADEVVAFMENNVEANAYSLRGYNVEDHAWHKSNKVYIYLTFTITSYLC